VDVFSVGVMLFELVTGGLARDYGTDLREDSFDDFIPESENPKEWVLLVNKMTAWDPHQRFTAAEAEKACGALIATPNLETNESESKSESDSE
jgi:serine/threonine protein kinase